MGILHDLISPLAELDGALVFNLEAHGDNRLQVVVFHFALNFPAALGLNN